MSINENDLKNEEVVNQRIYKTHQVLGALLRGEVLSGFDMLERFNLYRASGVIYYLRGMGYKIKTKLVPNADGIGVHGVYFMPNPSKPLREDSINQ